MRRRWPLAAAIALGLALGQAAAPALTQQVAAIQNLYLRPTDMSMVGLALFPCTINGHKDPACELDTGADVDLYMNTDEARYLGIPLGGSGHLFGITGMQTAKIGTTELRIGSSHASVKVYASDVWQGCVLVSLRALRALGVQVLAIDLQHHSLILVTPPAGSHG